MRHIACYFIALIFFSPVLWRGIGGEVQAQDTIPNSIQQKFENLTENSQIEEADYSSLLENLDYYKKHPVNLNNTNAEQLTEIGLLNTFQIENLLTHIDKNGKLITVYELQSIEGFDPQTIEKILPYIKVADIAEELHSPLNEILKHGNHEFIVRGQKVLEKQKGYLPIDSAGICNSPNSRYIGGPEKIYSRYRFSYGNNVSVGITAEKDPGELFFNNNKAFKYPRYDSLLNGKQRNGFDFYSAHFYIKNFRLIKALAIGDYQIGFGQGLTAWSGLAFGKSSDAMSISRNATAVRPYSSVDENRFMRGLALTAGTNQIKATGFISRKKMDANIILSNSAYEIISASSLQETGLHSTPAEISDKDAVTQTIYGGNISYRKRKYSLGLTGMHTLFNAKFDRTLSSYNQFEFNGKKLTNAGADYAFLIHNFNFFGEASLSNNSAQLKIRGNGFAFLNGCTVSLDPRLSLSILHRDFQRNYQNLSANAFSESSSTSNEQGFYFGITAKPINTIIIHSYYDHFTFPWLKYQVNAPSNGNEFLIQVDYIPSKKLNTYIRIKQKDKFVSSSSTNGIDFIIPYRQTNYRWHIGYQISRSIKLSNRIEYIETNKETHENGFLIYQDASYKKIGSNLSFTLRYALFDTKSFNSRIYAYENDIPSSYSIPSYYNKGSRVYVMVNYNITRRIEIWLRCSQIYYSNQNIISKGTLNEIQGQSKNEIKVQMRLKF
jgi:hypothetical protein